MSPDQTKILDSLVEFINEWKGSDILTGEELKNFVSDLQSEILKTTSFVNADASKLILYSGKATDGKYLYEKMDVFCKSNPEFYYITNTDAGTMLWDERFEKAVYSRIKDEAL